MVMAAVVSLALGVVPVAGGVWVNGYEFGGSAWTPERAGAVQVWAWAPGGGEVMATVGGQALSGKAPAAGKESPWTWAPLGTVNVEAGKAVGVASSMAAAVVLSDAAGFDPAKFVRAWRVGAGPEAVVDARAENTRNLNTVFMMPTYDQAGWETVRERIRRRMLIGCGLWPLPERTPLNAKIFDRVQHEDYSVEKVYFEARPGFVVTGNLYRPVGTGPFPGVLNPHGHWEHGRLEDTDKCSVPGRCITLARMGMVALSIDMLGYNDSFQFVHHFLQPAFSLWGIHPFSLQLWSSMRGLDLLESLPEVDKERLACTGASGGGTQTFALYSVDDRLKAACPVNMISSTMQGGCMCENAPIFRLGVSNMEVGAMMAPKPLLMVAATGDWTRETPRVEFPAIREIYSLYGAAGNVETFQDNAGHNYNKNSREAVYRFLGKHLLGGEQWAKFTEPPFTVEPEENLRVFPKGARPEGFPSSQQVIESIQQERRDTWSRIAPKNEDERAKFADENKHLLSDITGAVRVETNELSCERVDYEEREGYVVEKWLLGRKCGGERIPAVLHRGRDVAAQAATVLLSEHGKAAFAAPRTDEADVERLRAQGQMVLMIDTFLTGEQRGTAKEMRRVVEQFQDTYQMTDTDLRAQDVLTALGFLRARRDCTGALSVVAVDGHASLWALVAGAIDGGVARVVTTAVPEDELSGPLYIPGFAAMGGVDAVRQFFAPARTVLATLGGN